MSAISIKPFLLGGKWVSTSTTDPVVNPYTGHPIAQVCQAEPQHIQQAIDAAREVAPRLGRTPTHVRAAALNTIAEGLRARKEEVALLLSQEAGKPITDARREVDRGIQTFSIAAEESKRIPGEVLTMDLSPGTEPYRGLVQRFPIGPVLGITPFNFPLNLVAHKVAPCLAAGNPIVLKPAPQTPLTSLLLGEIFLTTGLPPESLAILPCSNALAERMVEHDVFQALSFTGSVTVGWMLKGKAGYKRVLLELGGNAGVIVEPDADLEAVIKRCVAGGFGYAGQTCISVQRVYVHESRYEPFLEAFVKQVEALPSGDPLQEATVVGPVINDQAAMRIETWIEEACSRGAKVRTGGHRHGRLFAPTVLTDVNFDMKVCCEEIFGPVVTVSAYRDFDEALAMLNSSQFGLQAGIFTNNLDKAFRAYSQLEVGAVLVNEIPTFRSDHMPYGGIKRSGLGREGVRYTIQELTEPRLLIIKTSS
jgi:acyl-CoA reductase-like NAD-dependent aldehyde dehydrogenase